MLEVNENACGFYIYGKNFHIDKDVSLILGLTNDQYQNVLINQFNAYKPSAGNYECYFKYKINCISALEWVNSMIVMQKLRTNI